MRSLNPLCYRLIDDNTGFNLIELVIVIALITVLSTVAISFYGQHHIRLSQLDAQHSLLALMQQQQDYYSQHQHYAVEAGIAQGIASQHGYYLITAVSCVDDVSNQCLSLKATPKAADAALSYYSLDSKNRKTPEALW